MIHPNTAFGSVRTLLRHTAAALALATAGLCAAPPALALTIANVDVPGQQSVAGRDLILNGAGLRQRFESKFNRLVNGMTGKDCMLHSVLREEPVTFLSVWDAHFTYVHAHKFNLFLQKAPRRELYTRPR